MNFLYPIKGICDRIATNTTFNRRPHTRQEGLDMLFLVSMVQQIQKSHLSVDKEIFCIKYVSKTDNNKTSYTKTIRELISTETKTEQRSCRVQVQHSNVTCSLYTSNSIKKDKKHINNYKCKVSTLKTKNYC